MTKKEMVTKLIQMGVVTDGAGLKETHVNTVRAMLRKAGVMGSLVVDTDENVEAGKELMDIEEHGGFETTTDEVKPASFYHMQFEHRSGNWGDVVTFRKEEDGNWICVGTATGRLKWMASPKKTWDREYDGTDRELLKSEPRDATELKKWLQSGRHGSVTDSYFSESEYADRERAGYYVPEKEDVKSEDIAALAKTDLF